MSTVSGLKAIRVPSSGDKHAWIMVHNIACVCPTETGCSVYFVGDDDNHIKLSISADELMMRAGFNNGG
jgi:hypothetical protein